ncbi:MAG: hypothetical protein ACMUJM_00165 [bacterium]
MIVQIDQKDLTEKWRKRKLDLFPGLQALKLLFLSRESYLNEAHKKLKESDVATWIQFLSSDDPKIYECAKEIIADNRALKEDIMYLILYSLDKITKEVYTMRLSEVIASYDVVFSMGCLIGYLFIRPDLKDMIYTIFSHLEMAAHRQFTSTQEYELFINEVFDAIEEDLSQRLPDSKKITSLRDLEKITTHLELMLLLYMRESSKEEKKSIEKEIAYIGSTIIGCLHDIEFSYDDPEELYYEFKKVIPCMGILRLKEDHTFLQQQEEELKNSKKYTINEKEIIILIEYALKMIEKPDVSLLDIVKGQDYLFIPQEVRKYAR